jgi:formylglycine-generating enzyme required for sulfatase activity/serine/threonine protein kinase
MRSPLAFFQFVARASLNQALFGAGGDLDLEVLPSVARDVWGWWGQGARDERLRADVQGLAALAGPEARALAGQAAAEAIATHPVPVSAAVRQALTDYLAQVPAAIRASQRRPRDPSGKTLLPGLPLGKPDDLLPLLPAGLARFRPGDRAPGFPDWVLEERLGRGGFGEVWKASNPHFAEPVALKVCTAAGTAVALRNEAKLLGDVMRHGKHPGIVTLLDTALENDPPCLKYEYVAGGDLGGLVVEWRGLGQAQRNQRALLLLQELASIVGFAHRLSPPIVHRDLKPANVLLEPGAAGAFRLRVADFGIGGITARQALELTRGGTLPGLSAVTALRGAYTPLYASPQQTRGDAPDVRDDVYALGVIGYQLLLGDLTASVGSDFREELAGRGLPEPVLDLLGHCVAVKAERRPADAAALADELRALLERPAEPGPATLGAPAAPAVPGPSGTAGSVVVYSLVALLVLVVLVGSAWLVAPRPPTTASKRLVPIKPKEDEGKPKEGEPKEEEGKPKENEGKPKSKEEAVNRPLADQTGALRAITNSIGMRLVLIPAGTFTMGSLENELGRGSDEDQHEVEISRAFYLGVYEVTQEEYGRVMGSNPSYFAPTGVGKDQVEGLDTSRFPVESVSWHDAVDFCRKLSEMPEEKRAGRRYRLPTEAEWEYSCRAGASRPVTEATVWGWVTKGIPFHFGASLSSTQANFNYSLGRTCAVGSYPPNAFGLRDMHGNVAEWCADRYASDYYTKARRADPKGPLVGTGRVVRGGSFFYEARSCRSACRFGDEPTFRRLTQGFRVALVPPRAPAADEPPLSGAERKTWQDYVNALDPKDRKQAEGEWAQARTNRARRALIRLAESILRGPP